MTLDTLDAAVEKCLVKKKGIQVGISSQFFYRSLYAVQLHNCFKVKKKLFIDCFLSTVRVSSYCSFCRIQNNDFDALIITFTVITF